MTIVALTYVRRLPRGDGDNGTNGVRIKTHNIVIFDASILNSKGAGSGAGAEGVGTIVAGATLAVDFAMTNANIITGRATLNFC